MYLYILKNINIHLYVNIYTYMCMHIYIYMYLYSVVPWALAPQSWSQSVWKLSARDCMVSPGCAQYRHFETCSVKHRTATRAARETAFTHTCS